MPARRLLLLIAALVAASGALSAAAAPAASGATVTLTNRALAPVEPNMASFSYEISGVTSMMGRSPDPPKKSFVRLLQNLQAQSGRRGPTIRIGGNSADESWWNPNGGSVPANTTYNITQADLDSYKNFLQALPTTHLVIDTTMRLANDTSGAVAHISAVGKTIGWSKGAVEAVEIGNECDIFSGNGIRPKNYTYSQYATEFQNYLSDLVSKAKLPPGMIQGATWCCNHFDSDMDSYIDTFHGNMSTVSYHRYPLDHCDGHMPTMDQLLEDHSTIDQAKMVAPWAKHSRQYGVPFRVGEGNSIACGGLKNVSDTMGAAIWSVDFMFNLAAVNVSMINFHGGGEGAYTAIGYANESVQVPDVRPLYYGMLLFTEVTRNMSVIYEASISNAPSSIIKAWAVRDLFGTVRITVIHKLYNATEKLPVTVDVSPLMQNVPETAMQWDLVNKNNSIFATYGLSWANLTFDGSQDGTPSGKRAGTQISRQGASSFTFYVQPATVSVLEVSPTD